MRQSAVPVLVDNSSNLLLILKESRAICRFLVSLKPDAAIRLIPDYGDLRATALFEEAACLELTRFDPFANKLVHERYYKPYFGLVPDQKVVEQLTAGLMGVLDKMDKFLEEIGFTAGEVRTRPPTIFRYADIQARISPW